MIPGCQEGCCRWSGWFHSPGVRAATGRCCRSPSSLWAACPSSPRRLSCRRDTASCRPAEEKKPGELHESQGPQRWSLQNRSRTFDLFIYFHCERSRERRSTVLEVHLWGDSWVMKQPWQLKFHWNVSWRTSELLKSNLIFIFREAKRISAQKFMRRKAAPLITAGSNPSSSSSSVPASPACQADEAPLKNLLLLNQHVNRSKIFHSLAIIKLEQNQWNVFGKIEEFDFLSLKLFKDKTIFSISESLN